MKKILALAIVSLIQICSAYACTTFFINKNGQLVFGRNYDWVTDAGMVCTNLRGLAKTSLKTETGETISWISQYGSITFNQYGKEFPTGGMNEKGLVVELMWLDDTKYPLPDSRPAIGVLQWIQYQLDNCSNIEEVIATDKKLRISPTGTTPLHYLIADAKGNVATIEFLNGKLVVHQGNDLSVPVLTNNRYDESVRAYKSAGTNGNNSLERFEQACNMVRQFNAGKSDLPAIDYAFNILAEVSQGDFTKWSVVYDLTNKSIQFRTARFKQIKTVNFSSFDFNCNADAKAWDMNQPQKGNVANLFTNFNEAINKRIVETAAKESEDRVPINAQNRQRLWSYSAGIKCN